MSEKYYIEREKNTGYPFDCHSQEMDRSGPYVQPHIHDYIEMIYCISGVHEFLLNDISYSVSGGDLVIINSREVHQISIIIPPSRYIVIKFAPELLYSSPKSIFEFKYMLPFTLQNANQQKVFKKGEIQSTEIPILAKNILHEYIEKRYGFELAIRGYICELFLWVLRHWREEGINLDFDDDLNESTMLKLKEVFEYIENNIQKDIKLESMAELCGFSYSYFSRLFKKITGNTFSAYLNSQRIATAQKLLAISEMNITEIAMECGFSTSSYFIEKFRAAKGISPKKYRVRITE